MKSQRQEGFLLRGGKVANDILIPRYYDPRVSAELETLRTECHLVSLSELVRAGHVIHAHGDYVPKIFYGTGPFPYIRTSDLANWEIKASPKHGVPGAVFEDYAPGQGVRPEDIFFVHEGTYLIGAAAMVTEFDGPLLYQHHLAKFSVTDSAPFNAYFFLAALESPIVRRQVRTKQFSADIIDSVVGRLEEIVIPFPKNRETLRELEIAAKTAVVGRAKLRQKLAHAAEEVDLWLRGARTGELEGVIDWEPDPKARRKTAFLGGRRGFSATVLEAREVAKNVLLPKYYDPWVSDTYPNYLKRCAPQTVGELVNAKLLSIQTGDEIGRLNYGTGDIPFIRTSDFGSWELKREAKQGVSEDVYNLWASSQDVQAGDILLVRDGTYLVGTSVLVCNDDLPLLFCGGIYKLRSLNSEALPPGLLFAMFNFPFVQRQIRNKQFTRDVIDTLGQRVLELVLPLPSDKRVSAIIGNYFESSLAERTRLRTRLHDLTDSLFGSWSKLDLANNTKRISSRR
jgi:hypothetical protein